MKKRGLLTPGHHGTLSWKRGDSSCGSIGYQSFTDKVVLKYKHRLESNDWEVVEQNIFLRETPFNYGGHRKWFICQNCTRSAAVLSGHGKLFLCRQCYRLPYQSQQVSDADRYQNKAGKIKERLGILEAHSLSRPVYDFDRPSYMHWNKFNRLKNEANFCMDKSISKLKVIYGDWADALF